MPNLIPIVASMMRARLRRRPRPRGSGTVDHAALGRVLQTLASGGIGALPVEEIAGYVGALSGIDPDTLGRDDALAYWINLYNAGALAAAGRTWGEGRFSIMTLPGAFTTPFVTVAGEPLSLDDVEHGKVRRFGDPRIHAALVCGSVSCPTFRHEPFVGVRLDVQLEDQMRLFLSSGGAVPDRTGGVVSLSRIFRWYGTDFVRPNRMPTVVPVRPRRVLHAITRWLDAGDAAWVRTERPVVAFQPYDWALGCVVGPPAAGSAGALS